MTRQWNEEERNQQSRLAQEQAVWQYSSGAKTPKGKRTVSLNSTKSGYYSETFRYYRKSKRSAEARRIEKLIREVCKENNNEKVFRSVERIKAKLEEYCHKMDQEGVPPTKVMEGAYLSSLIRTVVNNCVTDRIISDLHKAQNQDDS
jgi:hypothetical protein